MGHQDFGPPPAIARLRRWRWLIVLLIALIGLGLLLPPVTSTHGQPSTVYPHALRAPVAAAPSPVTVPTRRPAPRASRSRPLPTRTVLSDGVDWAALGECESSSDPRADTGNGFYGLYQFTLRSWRAVGGSGMPQDATVAEQTHRAQLLRAEQGMRRGWPACSRKLGLR